jgi:hypothetical protein
MSYLGNQHQGRNDHGIAFPPDAAPIASWPNATIPPKLYRIGDLVDFAGVSRQTIHNYAAMGLIHEAKWTQGGHRLFDETVFSRLTKIAELKSQQLSIQEIHHHLQTLDLAEPLKP